MLPKILFSAVPAAALAFAAGAACAQTSQFGTAAEAKAMEERVIAELKASGKAAFDKFNKAGGEFRDRDLYVFCFDTQTGIYDATVNPALVGTDIRALKEKDGSPFGQKLFDATKTVPDGSIQTVDYNYPKPNTTNPVPKQSFIAKVGGEACGVGYYK